MTQSEFLKSAQFIAKRNVSELVAQVLVSFEQSTATVHVIYLTKSIPSEAEVEWCELTCAELIAEFPEIKHADTKCLAIEEYDLEIAADSVVFSRL
jgi:hypothetical protein